MTLKKEFEILRGESIEVFTGDPMGIPCIETSDPEKLCKHPLVSVCMITYNHEAFIRQAIEGVVMQKADFEYELVIGEDCSQDRTREICFEYQKKYPEVIRVLWANENVYRRGGNARRTRARCRGKYIAFCEGDDYWTDPEKLQKQVEYMEGHPGCALSFHKQWVAGMDGMVPEKNRTGEAVWRGVAGWPTVDRDYLLTHAEMVPPTVTQMVRRACLGDLPAWSRCMFLGDRLRAVWCAGKGTIDYVSGIGAGVYRRHPGGVSSMTGFVAQDVRMLESDMAFIDHLDIGKDVRKQMMTRMAERAARSWMARGELDDVLCKRFEEEIKAFGKRHSDFKWACRWACFWGAWKDKRFRALMRHRWWGKTVSLIRTLAPAWIYRWERSMMHGLKRSE